MAAASLVMASQVAPTSYRKALDYNRRSAVGQMYVAERRIFIFITQDKLREALNRSAADGIRPIRQAAGKSVASMQVVPNLLLGLKSYTARETSV